MASTYRFWLSVFGVICFLRDGHRDRVEEDALEIRVRVVGQDAERRADVRRLDRQPRPDPGQELLHDAGPARHLPLVPAQRDLVPAGDDPEGELRLQQTQVLVVPAQEGPEVDLGARVRRWVVGSATRRALGLPHKSSGITRARRCQFPGAARPHAGSPAPPGADAAGGWGRATSIASSRSWSGLTGVGASVRGQVALLGLGERDDVPDGLDAGQDGDDPVQPERDAAHRRGAVLEGLQEEAELGPRRRPRRSRGSRRPAAGARASGCGSSPRRSPGRSARGRRPWRAPRRGPPARPRRPRPAAP